MGLTPNPDPYVCDWCKTRHPVPSLARDCEHRHLEENE